MEKMRHIGFLMLAACWIVMLLLSACGTMQGSAALEQPQNSSIVISEAEPSLSEAQAAETITPETRKPEMEKTLHMTINDTEVCVAWENNESVTALTELVSAGRLTVPMSMYGGFEQVGSLGTSLPRNDSRTTTEAGDIVLYSGEQIVVFYGSNSWAYTRLGRITDKSAAELAELLGNGDVTITITMEEIEHE